MNDLNCACLWGEGWRVQKCFRWCGLCGSWEVTTFLREMAVKAWASWEYERGWLLSSVSQRGDLCLAPWVRLGEWSAEKRGRSRFRKGSGTQTSQWLAHTAFKGNENQLFESCDLTYGKSILPIKRYSPKRSNILKNIDFLADAYSRNSKSRFSFPLKAVCAMSQRLETKKPKPIIPRNLPLWYCKNALFGNNWFDHDGIISLSFVCFSVWQGRDDCFCVLVWVRHISKLGYGKNQTILWCSFEHGWKIVGNVLLRFTIVVFCRIWGSKGKEMCNVHNGRSLVLKGSLSNNEDWENWEVWSFGGRWKGQKMWGEGLPLLVLVWWELVNLGWRMLNLFSAWQASLYDCRKVFWVIINPS